MNTSLWREHAAPTLASKVRVAKLTYKLAKQKEMNPVLSEQQMLWGQKKQRLNSMKENVCSIQIFQKEMFQKNRRNYIIDLYTKKRLNYVIKEKND